MDVFGALSFPQLTDKDVLIWLGVFFGVLLVFDGLRQVSRRSGGEASARNRRMRMMSKGADQEQILAALTRNDVRGNETIGTAGRLRRMLRRADLSVALSTVVIGSVALGALAAVGLSQLAGLPAAAIGVLGALLLPVMVIAQMGNARMEKLVRQLPDALDIANLSGDGIDLGRAPGDGDDPSNEALDPNAVDDLANVDGAPEVTGNESPVDADAPEAVDGSPIDGSVVDVPDALESPPERLTRAFSREPAFGGNWLLPGALAALGGAMATLGVGALAIWRRTI